MGSHAGGKRKQDLNAEILSIKSLIVRGFSQTDIDITAARRHKCESSPKSYNKTDGTKIVFQSCY